MNTVSVQLKSGNYLLIPAEFYPRYTHIVATKENSLCFTPINRFVAAIKTASSFIFNPVFAVLSVINLSLCTPLLVTNNSLNPKTTYYFYLFLGFIISYYLTKAFTLFTSIRPFSTDRLAHNLGYSSFESALKPYDSRMLQEIIHVNDLKGYRRTLYFDDLYGILFDVATPRRLYDTFGPSRLRVVK